MQAYLTPGIYQRTRPATEQGVRAIRTDVVGFVGYAERGPLPDITSDKPHELAVRLTSWKEFQAVFGGLLPSSYLAYAVRAFFENGGTTCYVVRVAATTSGKLPLAEFTATCTLPGDKGTALTIRAISPGHWGTRLKLTVTPLAAGAAISEFALRVKLERGRDQSLLPEEEFYSRLSLSEGSPFYAPARINRVSQLIHVTRGMSSRLDVTALQRTDALQWQGGKDGLRDVSLRDFLGGMDDLRGLRLLEDVDEVSVLCAPDAVLAAPAVVRPRPLPPRGPCEAPLKEEAAPPTDAAAPPDDTAQPPVLDAVRIYYAMIEQCERLRDRVVVLDPPPACRTIAQALAWRQQFSSSFAALYFPWLQVPDALALTGTTRTVPPSGHVAGIYARLDNQFGVQRPPANAPLEFVTDVEVEINDTVQEQLNPASINAIRNFPGRGIRIWGARSLAAPSQSEWRFVHARRLVSMLEEAIEDSMQWTTFEPNDETLRRTLAHSLTVFLESIWRTGGLQGTTPSQGFYVKCDETNNPPAVINAGQLVCEIGVAVAAPMEFIVFEVRRRPGATEIAQA